MLTDNFQYRKIIFGFAGLSLTIAGMVLFGWVFSIPFLKQVLPTAVSMKFNTAVCFALFSITLLLYTKTSAFIKYLRRILSITGIAIGATTLLFLAMHINGGLDQIFVEDNLQTLQGHPYPGRMSPQTALCFVCLGFGILLSYSKKLNFKIFAQCLFHFVTFMGFIAALGYLFSVPTFYSMSLATSMALHTSFTFIMLSIACALLNPSLALAGVFTGQKLGNLMARKLFFQMSLLIIFLGYLRILSHKKNMVNVEFGIALFACSFITASLFLIWKTSGTINKVEAKRTLAEQNFKLAVEATPSALIMTDENGKITLVNRQAEILFGYSKDEMLNQTMELFVPERFRGNHPQHRNNYQAVPVKRNFGAEWDLYAMRKDGTEFPVEIGLNPISTNKGHKVLSTIVDISERKKTEEIIRNQIAELKLKNKELEQFTYIASHDLQEPLRTVSNFITVIEEDYPEALNPEIKEYFEYINAATSRMNILIRSLLDFSRLGKGRQLSDISCETLLKDVLSDLNRLIKSSDAKIVVHNLPKIKGYETELRQVFQNLINNAIKFSKPDQTPHIEISAHPVSNGYEFWVADNGIGIEPKYFDKIFHIFQRLNTSDEGYGIGLANCLKIVQMHSGKIWVESQPGQGSTFKFIIKNL
jgi:PAS domain S-box-containing protein